MSAPEVNARDETRREACREHALNYDVDRVVRERWAPVLAELEQQQSADAAQVA